MVARALFAVLIVAWIGIELATLNVPYGPYGWNIGADAKTVTYVTPHGAVAEAGVKVGDKVDWPSLPLLGRVNLVLVQQFDENQPLTATIVHDGKARVVTLRAHSWGAIYNSTQHISHLIGQLFGLFALVLLYLRPSRMTWAFLLSTMVFAFPQAAAMDFGHRSMAGYLLADSLSAIIRGLSAAGILIFVCRFPDDRVRRPLALLDRAAPYIGAAVTLEALYVTLAMFAPAPPPSIAVAAFQSLMDIAVTILAVCALVISASSTSGSERQRIIPVLAAYAFYVTSHTFYQVQRATTTDATVLATFFLLMAVASIALGAAVTYGIVRHRVIDVSFAVSRTLVYTLLTAIVVGAFALVDFISSKLLEHLQIAILLEAAVALAFGVWLNALHSRVDKFVDRVLFRRRHLAEARLERAARSLAHAESTSFVDETLVLEALDAMNLVSAAVFRRAQDGYERVYASGWNAANAVHFGSDEPLVVTLRAELQPIDVATLRAPAAVLPEGREHPLLAVPLVARHHLSGFVLYGGHAGGEAIDAGERAVLENLCHHAAAAYEHLRAAAIAEDAAALRAENTLLRHDTALLREIVRGGANIPG